MEGGGADYANTLDANKPNNPTKFWSFFTLYQNSDNFWMIRVEKIRFFQKMNFWRIFKKISQKWPKFGQILPIYIVVGVLRQQQYHADLH